ncbi:hypothetical protein ACIKN1_22440, partial [Klebsiella aerogenes]
MTLFATFRWPVKLALLIIALLAAIAMSSGWWLPYDPAAIDLHQRLLSPGDAHRKADQQHQQQAGHHRAQRDAGGG